MISTKNTLGGWWILVEGEGWGWDAPSYGRLKGLTRGSLRRRIEKLKRPTTVEAYDKNFKIRN